MSDTANPREPIPESEWIDLTAAIKRRDFLRWHEKIRKALEA